MSTPKEEPIMVDTDLRAAVARRLGMKPSEIVDVVEYGDDDAVLVTTHDGVKTRIDERGTHVVAAPLPVRRNPATGEATPRAEAPAVPQPDGTSVDRAPGVGAALFADEADLCPECHGTGLRNVDETGLVETVPAPRVTAPDDNPDNLDDDVPDGTTEHVLTWVGDDPQRAQRALDAEQGREKPRSGLTSHLEKVVADAEQA